MGFAASFAAPTGDVYYVILDNTRITSGGAEPVGPVTLDVSLEKTSILPILVGGPRRTRSRRGRCAVVLTVEAPDMPHRRRAYGRDHRSPLALPARKLRSRDKVRKNGVFARGGGRTGGRQGTMGTGAAAADLPAVAQVRSVPTRPTGSSTVALRRRTRGGRPGSP